MSDMTENFGDLEFAQNSDPRIPIVLILDCSDSMMEKRPGEDRSPFEALNGGLDTLWAALHNDPLAKRRAEVSFVTFGSDVSEPTAFKTVDEMVLPELRPMGVTSTGEAVIAALDAVEARKQEYRANGIQYYRPIVILITDGLSTSDTSEAKQRLAEGQTAKKLTFFPVGVSGADLGALEDLAGKRALMLQGLKFEEFFVWVSASAASVSASQPGDQVAAPSPEGWAEL